MKHIRAIILVAICAASLTGAGYAGGMMKSGPMMGNMQSWLGTWSCTGKSGTYTSTFTSILGGKSMRLSDTGKVQDEQIVTWDSKSRKWIDQYADVTGAYATMEGTPSGKTIRFTQVFPTSGSSTGVVTRKSQNTYTSAFTTTMNGKTTTSNDTCTKS